VGAAIDPGGLTPGLAIELVRFGDSGISLSTEMVEVGLFNGAGAVFAAEAGGRIIPGLAGAALEDDAALEAAGAGALPLAAGPDLAGR